MWFDVNITKKTIQDQYSTSDQTIIKSAVFFNIVQKAFDPPPFRLNTYVVNFSEGILTKVRKRPLQQLSKK